MIKYKTFDLRKEKNFIRAEKLKEKGWKIGSIGFNTIELFEESIIIADIERWAKNPHNAHRLRALTYDELKKINEGLVLV